MWGECRWCETYMAFHTLSLKGEPTMGTCPNWTESKCVLLSQIGCEKWEKRF